MRIHGTLEPSLTVPGILVPERCDPRRRYWGVEREDSIDVIDSQGLACVASFESVLTPRSRVRLAPDARRVVLRAEGRLAIRTPSETLAEVRTATTRLTWDGKRPDAGVAPEGGYADEHFGFSADGRYIWLATHDVDCAPCIQLYDDKLALLDVFTDLRDYSPYVTSPDKAFARMEVWSESWLDVEPHATEWVLGGCNTGDSCGTLIAFRIDGDRIVAEQESLARAVFAIDAYAVRHLSITARAELLLLDRDGLLSISAWPPDGTAARVKQVNPSDGLRDESNERVLPLSDAEGLDIGDNVTTTREHVLVGVESDDGRVGVIALDADTLDARGLIASSHEEWDLVPLCWDRFATVDEDARETTFWRLQRR